MFSFLASSKTTMVDKDHALPGRPTPLAVPAAHTVLGTPLTPPWPAGLEEIVVGMGCFWGAERRLWQQPGVYSTSVGYAGGFTPNPTYEEVCTGKTGHSEVVRVVFDPTKTSLAALLKVFFEDHDPTQGMRQGNDVGTQYRSVIYWTTPAQEQVVRDTTKAYDDALQKKGFGPVTTELRSMDDVGAYFFAEGYHQQYLDKNPNGYCGLAGTGVSCPIGVGVRL
ncbi:MAG TPA: peptide-methionine (S)-S-oxide reductase MsrA [Myxococcota bacterium]